MKFENPNLYAWMRLLKVFTFDVRTSFEETLAPESAAGIFSEDFWRTVGQSYLNFRLDQAPDFVLDDPEAQTEDERTRLRQLGARVFGLSDVTFGAVGLIVFIWTFNHRNRIFDQIYGWETPRRPRLQAWSSRLGKRLTRASVKPGISATGSDRARRTACGNCASSSPARAACASRCR